MGFLVDTVILVLLGVVLVSFVPTTTLTSMDFALLGVGDLAYWSLLVSYAGGTVGHHVAGIVPVDAVTGAPLDLGQSSLRGLFFASSFFSEAVAPGITPAVEFLVWVSFLWCGWDGARQGLHDKAAGALVIRTR